MLFHLLTTSSWLLFMKTISRETGTLFVHTIYIYNIYDTCMPCMQYTHFYIFYTVSYLEHINEKATTATKTNVCIILNIFEMMQDRQRYKYMRLLENNSMIVFLLLLLPLLVLLFNCCHLQWLFGLFRALYMQRTFCTIFKFYHRLNT